MSNTSQEMPLSWQSADLGLESSFGPYFLMPALNEPSFSIVQSSTPKKKIIFLPQMLGTKSQHVKLLQESNMENED